MTKTGALAAEPLGRPRLGPRRFDRTVARRRGGDQGIQQFAGGLRHLRHRPVEGLLIGFRGARTAAELAHELQRRGADLRLGRRRGEIVQRLDGPAHDGALAEKTGPQR